MTDLSHVMRIDFTRDYGNWSENLVALFNINKISEAEVREFIYNNNNTVQYHPDIIILSPEQFNRVFLNK